MNLYIGFKKYLIFHNIFCHEKIPNTPNSAAPDKKYHRPSACYPIGYAKVMFTWIIHNGCKN